jgi:hypothetical protein
MSEEKLQVGDVVYCKFYDDNLKKTIVERVTNTLAVTKDGTKLNRIYYTDGTSYISLREKTREIWVKNIYYLETEELKIKYYEQNINLFLKNVVWEKIDIKTKEQVFHILKESEKKEGETL